MVRRRTTASPQRVWAVLSDGWRYAEWVPGTACIRAVEGPWPHRGARIHHTVGIWPGRVHDSTEVLLCEPGRRLLLQASGRPAGQALVDLMLHGAPGGGCDLVLAEDVSHGPALLVPGPVRRFALDVRNVETLRRLATLAEHP